MRSGHAARHGPGTRHAARHAAPGTGRASQSAVRMSKVIWPSCVESPAGARHLEGGDRRAIGAQHIGPRPFHMSARRSKPSRSGPLLARLHVCPRASISWVLFYLRSLVLLLVLPFGQKVACAQLDFITQQLWVCWAPWSNGSWPQIVVRIYHQASGHYIK